MSLRSTSHRITHLSKGILPSYIQNERTRVLSKNKSIKAPARKHPDSPIYYWMQRDMRVQDNWALLTAHHFSKREGLPLKVMYIFPKPESLPQRWTERYITFLYQGLLQVKKDLGELNIPFELYYPGDDDGSNSSNSGLSTIFESVNASAVICDFSPLRHVRESKSNAASILDTQNVPLYEVDAHNVIPCWHVSDKREVGARTLRSKINRLLPEFCVHFPTLEKYDEENMSENTNSSIDLEVMMKYMKVDTSVKLPSNLKGGTEEGMKQFSKFLKFGLKKYNLNRNDPNDPSACSSMSYYINFGHVSFQRLALIVRDLKNHPDVELRNLKNYSDAIASFMEEGVVRRELSDNFVFYVMDWYDSLDGAYPWARETLQLHSSDKREHIYTKEELETGKTHDDLWNAAQLQVVHEGGMHGFLRMYWAKKILEWTPDANTALHTAQYFNDKYALDGNDPNGYVGVAWSIMGIHDQGWKERDIFGKIRYMNYDGCKRKFKVQDFVARYKKMTNSMNNALKKKNSVKHTISSSSNGGKKRKKV